MRIVRTSLSEVRLPVLSPAAIELMRSAALFYSYRPCPYGPHTSAPSSPAERGASARQSWFGCVAEGWTVVAAGRADGDLRTRAGAASLAAKALDELGGLDLVVHAAGDAFAPKPIEDVTEEDWDAALDVTAKGTFFLAQAAAPALRESKGVS